MQNLSDVDIIQEKKHKNQLKGDIMAIKFKNSLFGFNKDDVFSFVVASKEKEQKLREELNTANSLNSELSAKLNDVLTEVEELRAVVSDYKAREESITKLSESIGRLYIVAQANAKAVSAAIDENVKASEQTVSSNIATADLAESNLTEIEKSLSETVEEFTEELEKIKSQLKFTKQTIAKNNKNIKKSQNELKSETEKVTVEA